jgi:flagellar motor switch protein FliM
MTDDPADMPDAAPGTRERAESDRPAAAGILRCLEMLAEEATTLKLPQTLDALHRAMAVCAVEAVEVTDKASLLMSLPRPPDATLH